MFSSKKRNGLLGLAAVFLIGIALFYIPAINYRLAWRLDAASAYFRGIIYPAENAPAPLPPVTRPVLPTPTPTVKPTQTPTRTPGPTATLTPSPTPLPAAISLPAPRWEKQDWNNCGPTTLALYLRTYQWGGDQFDISRLLKPERGDRNVNVEELVYYVRTQAGWLNAEYRVGGNIELLKQLLSEGFPVMIEEGFLLETGYWPNDDRWAGHYLLLTGYNDQAQSFTAQDSFLGPDREVSYQNLDTGWKAFNRVYILLYPPEAEGRITNILGSQWDPDQNRRSALETAQMEIEANPEDGFAWFNLGSNYVYFEQYAEAAKAYDQARTLGLPQRMFRYQFGPFIAYFQAFRIDDLMALTEYALQRTPNSEEALLWHGWGLYRQGDVSGALKNFRSALNENPFYQDAQYAINFVTGN